MRMTMFVQPVTTNYIRSLFGSSNAVLQGMEDLANKRGFRIRRAEL